MGSLQNKSIASKYFQRFGFRERLISAPAKNDLGIIVVIPAYDEDQLMDSLESLINCEKPKCSVEILVVLNASEADDLEVKAKNLQSYEDIQKLNSALPIYPILENELPRKHAGVGLARKIGMDEAARRFSDVHVNGVIACFDADSFVDPNYLCELESQLLQADFNGASIYFEHPLEGSQYPQECYQGIINYELFLRYYNLALKYAGLPFGFHTVGSSMAVKSVPYMLQGGMNKRKAGEDFYFLQKIIQTGKFGEINSTKVVPSPRTSDRVPFGTGKAISDWIQEGKEVYTTYDVQVFDEVKSFVESIPKWFSEEFKYDQVPLNLRIFFKEDRLQEKIEEVKRNTITQEAFCDRFYVYFDAFKMLKLVHWYRDEIAANKPLLEMVNALAKRIEISSFTTEKEALLKLRDIERT